jgi:hypothetical protein
VVCVAHLFILSNDEQAGLEPLATVAATVRNDFKFSQCNVAWGGFPQARDLGCKRFDSGWCFISTSLKKEKKRGKKKKSPW